MIAIPVELVILAVQAGVRLYSGLREAYAASIKEAAVTLPLPRVEQGGLEPDFGTVADFIKNHGPPADPTMRADFQRQREDVLPIVNAFNAGQFGPQPPADEDFVARAFYKRWVPILDPSSSGNSPGDATTASAILAVLSIRQWTKGQPGAPVPWQIALGTLVDVAVLWFANDPGAISTSRPEGKALKAFLTAMQDVDFAHAKTTQIVTDTMVAVLDTVAAYPGVITNGERESLLIKATTTSIAGAIKKIPAATLDSLNTNEVEKLSFIAQSLAAATLRAGAATVLDNPKLFYIDTPQGPQTRIVEQVGNTFMDLILPVEVGGQGKIDVAGAISAKGFEMLLRSALAAVGNNIEILHLQGDNEKKRLSPLLAALATAFSKAPLPSSVQAAFSETAAIVISATDRNIDTLWPDKSLDPSQNLARGAVVVSLDAIAEIAVGAGGLSAFTTEDVVRLADAVVASVAKNPRLMDALPGGDPYLKVAVEAMLKALAQQSLGKLSAADAVVIIAAGIEAATLKLPLLAEAKPGSIVLKAVLEAVFGALAEVRQTGSDAAKWRATGRTLLVDLVKTTFDAVANLPDAKQVRAPQLDAVKAALVKAISEGRPLTAGDIVGALTS
jgi:hypothetical protein